MSGIWKHTITRMDISVAFYILKYMYTKCSNIQSAVITPMYLYISGFFLSVVQYAYVLPFASPFISTDNI